MTETRDETARPRRPQERLGVVVSARTPKTVVVEVVRLVRHGLYRKTLRRTSAFMAHDELGARDGDRVRIVESRPLSKRKRWRVAEIVERSADLTGSATEKPEARETTP
jgi:small subunit ribosomal protein S17